MSRSKGRAVLLAIGVLAGAAGCGSAGDTGSSTTAAEGRRVSTEEASLLADVLVRNLEAKGAGFDLRMTVSGAEVRFEGSVDWVGHAGMGVLSVGDADGYEVRWTTDAVLQALPGLGERLAALGQPGATWIVRPADPDGNRLDVAIAFLTALAGPTPDNPVNLQQQADVEFVRHDRVQGAEVTVLAKGRLTLWIGEDGRLRRAEAPFAFADEPGVLDLDRFGPVAVELPARSSVVEAGDHPEIYRELTQLTPL